MPEPAAERLKEFRAQNHNGCGPRGGWVVFGGFLAGGAVVIAAVLAFAPYRMRPNAASPNGGLSEAQLRNYAAYLADKKLPLEAIAAYGKYLETASLDPGARAKVCYSVAALALEAERYDTALAYLYQAEMLDPNTELKSEIDKKIVLCLDKTGRSADLRRELKKRTSPKRTAADVQAGETVLAEFAGEVITDRDLETAIDRLPAPVRESIDTPEKKADFLKNIVAERLLVDKALRQELAKDPEVERQMAEQRDALVVRKLIENEVHAKLAVTPEDIQRYYTAEIKRFTQPASAQVRIGKADSEEAAKALTEFSKELVTVRDGGHIPGLAASPEAVSTIFAAEPGSTTAPIPIEGTWYVCKVESKTPEKVSSLEDVKTQAEKMLRARKEQEQVVALIEETLKARDVRLYPERLQKEEKETQAAAK